MPPQSTILYLTCLSHYICCDTHISSPSTSHLIFTLKSLSRQLSKVTFIIIGLYIWVRAYCSGRPKGRQGPLGFEPRTFWVATTLSFPANSGFRLPLMASHFFFSVLYLSLTSLPFTALQRAPFTVFFFLPIRFPTSDNHPRRVAK